MNPKYPVYIISKGRWESRLTSKALEKMNVPYHIVVEKQELEQYKAVIDRKKILTLPSRFKDNYDLGGDVNDGLSKGSGPARNFCWEHSIKRGAERHWVMDDNIRDFYRLNRNIKWRVQSGTILKVMEDFVNRYENIAIAGPQYELFIPRKRKTPPYILNTRVYSCLLINNQLPFRWRGRYNEDTDLCLRVLKEGECIVLFQAFLQDKMSTLQMKGGNDKIYQATNNRLEFAESLQNKHPDLVKVTKKFRRWHHHVDYSPFKKNKLKLKLDIHIPEGINNYGMKLITKE